MTSAELITALQASRPVAADTLRDRVRAIAAAEPVQRPSPFARLPRISLRRFALVAVPATAVVLLGTAGVVGLLDSGSQPQVESSAARELRAQATTTTPSADATTAPQLKAGAPPAAADATAPTPTTGRATRYSAQLTLAVKDVDGLSAATQKALQITRDLGGYVVSVSYATSDTGVSSLTLRVPTANVQDALVRLTELGKIVSQQVQIDDLQAQVDELTKRETALRGQIARLSARLADPDLDAQTRATLEARRDAARAELGASADDASPGQRRGALRHDPADAADAAVGRRGSRPVALGRRGRPGRRDPRCRGDDRPLRTRRRRPVRPAGNARVARTPRPPQAAGRASALRTVSLRLRRLHVERRDQRLRNDLERPARDLARLP